MPFFVPQYASKEEEKQFIEKEIKHNEKLGIMKKGLMRHWSSILLVKRKCHKLCRFCRDFCVLSDNLITINHAFLLA